MHKKNGIAPAMKTDWAKTFWGTDLDENLSKQARKLLGGNLELHTPGSNRRKTDEREAAVEIIQDPEVDGYNARQVLLNHKAAHGSGNNPTFPEAEEIKTNMQDYPASYYVNIFGDGSYTSPTIWWAALGGYGVWMPEWISPNQAHCNGTHEEVQAEEQGRLQQQNSPMQPNPPQQGQSSCSRGEVYREGIQSGKCQIVRSLVAGDISPQLRRGHWLASLDNPSGIQSLPVDTPLLQLPETP